MILTGKEIIQQVDLGCITIEPFQKDQVNPNSYNYRIGTTIKVFSHTENNTPVFIEKEIPEIGFILEPHTMYLANTFEVIGSRVFAMSLIGKSSIGRLGLFLQVSANLGHTTSCHKWTLELVATKSIKIYPNMILGQVSFWENRGEIENYKGQYGYINKVQESKIYDTYR